MIIKESDMLKLIGGILMGGRVLLKEMETKEKFQVHIEYDDNKEISLCNFLCKDEITNVVHFKKEVLKTGLSTGITIAKKLNEAMGENFCATVSYDTEKGEFEIKFSKEFA